MKKRRTVLSARIFVIVIPAAFILTAGIVFFCHTGSQRTTVCQTNVNRLKALESTDISAIQDSLDALNAAEAAAHIESLPDVSAGESLDDVQIRQVFSGCAIVGDSITEGISAYGFLDTDVVVSKRGIRTDSSDEQIATAIGLAPSHIFLALGSNDMEVFHKDTAAFTDAYRVQLNKIRSALPDAQIYINSVLPVQQFAIDANPSLGYYSLYNQALEELCQEMGCTFIDNTFLVEGNDSMYEVDGEHMVYNYYPLWLTNMAETAGLV